MSDKKLSSIDKFGKIMIIIIIGLFTSLLIVNIGLGLHSYYIYTKYDNYTAHLVAEEATVPIDISNIHSLSLLGKEATSKEALTKNDIFDIFIEQGEHFHLFISPNLERSAQLQYEENQLIISNLTSEKTQGSLYITIPEHHDFHLVTKGTARIFVKNANINTLSLGSKGLLDFSLENSSINTFDLISIGEVNLESKESKITTLDAEVTGKAQAQLYLTGEKHSIQNMGIGNYQLTGKGSVEVHSSGYLRVNHSWSMGMADKEVVIS